MTAQPLSVPAVATGDRDAVRPPAWFPAAAAGAGAGAALLTVDARPGLGLVLEIALVAAVLLAAMRRSVTPFRWGLAALGVPLAVMPAVRDAEWLVALDVLAVAALGCLVLVGVDTWTSVVHAGLSVAVRVFSAPMFLLRGLAPGLAGRAAPALRGAAVAVVLLAVFGALFATADGVFGEAVSTLLPDLQTLPVRAVVFGLGTCLTAAGLAAHLAPLSLAPPRSRDRVRARLEWALPLGALVALFAAFVAVQFAVLFAGRDHVVRTAGLTFAEYARSGFAQLLVAVALVLAVAAVCVRRVAPADAGERRLLQALLGSLGALTLVVLASAVRRLVLYTDAFGLTHARVLAAALAAWLAVVLVAGLVALGRWSAAWLPRAVVVATAAVLLALNLANPEARIAESQVARFERTGELDVFYVGGLGADAVPALAALPPRERGCVLLRIADRLREPDPWTGGNLARARAREVLREAPPDESRRRECDPYAS